MTHQSAPNPLFRLLLWNWLAGAVAALVLIGGLLATDAMHLRHLIFASESPVVPMAMLGVGFLTTLCSVAMGSAVMAMSSDDDEDERGRRVPVSFAELSPVRVVAATRQARRRTDER